jgi:hypothetical protein
LACSKNNDVSPESAWMKVYDHSDFNRLFYALDVRELSDNSFIVLASDKPDTVIWPKPFLIKVNNLGEAIWETETSDFNSPVPSMITINGNYYFFAMDNALGTSLLKVDINGSSPTLEKSFPSLTYPLSAFQTTDNKILLVSYNRLTRSTVLTCFDSSFNQQWSTEYNGIENYEEKVRLHLTRQGSYFPFFAGEISSSGKNYYFLNGFYNFVFSLLFVNKTNGALSGVINGIPYSAAASSLIQRTDSNFVLTRYDENQNYINLNASLSFTSISNITALGGSTWPEIETDAVIIPLNTTINNNKVTILATVTRSKQVLVMIFNSVTGKLNASKYFGSGNPVNLASVITTNEGGLAVLTQTFVAGRFPRIQLFKISPDELRF